MYKFAETFTEDASAEPRGIHVIQFYIITKKPTEAQDICSSICYKIPSKNQSFISVFPLPFLEMVSQNLQDKWSGAFRVTSTKVSFTLNHPNSPRLCCRTDIQGKS